MLESIQKHLGDKAKSLLDHKCTTIPRESLHLPGPEYLDEMFIPSDRPNRVLNRLAWLFKHGRLSGTGYVSEPLLNAVAGTWSEQNPAAAAAWASSLADSHARSTAEVAAVTGWAEQNPASAADYVTKRIAGKNGSPPSAQEAVNLASVIARIWGESNPQEAAGWIGKLASNAERIEAAAALAMAWASSDIKGAVAWSSTLGG